MLARGREVLTEIEIAMFPKPTHYIILLALLIILLASPASAGGPKSVSDRLHRMFTESTIMAGYGSGNLAEGKYDYIALIWQLGLDLKTFFPVLERHQGILTGFLEPKINPVIKPETDLEFGIGLGLKYRYPLSEKLSAYVIGAVGPHFITVQTADQANGFIFFDSLGAGVSVHLTEKTGLNLEYRFRHMSNASIKEPNNGVNTHMLFVGYILFF